jgi:hypothetical protein
MRAVAAGFPLPLTVLLITVGGGWLVAMVFYVLRDKKWRMRRGVSDGTDGRFAVTISVPNATLFDEGTRVRLAREAMTQVGGVQISVTSGGAVVGWIGSPWTNVARWAEYQMVIIPSQQGDGSAVFLSLSSPKSSRGGDQLEGRSGTCRGTIGSRVRSGQHPRVRHLNLRHGQPLRRRPAGSESV